MTRRELISDSGGVKQCLARARGFGALIMLCGVPGLSSMVSGCAVVSVVGTAANVAATAASTAIDLGAGAVRVTGKVIGKGVDIVTGSPPTPPRP